jgi:hypothetical protein
MKSLFQALVLVVVIVGGFIVFVGLFSGECSSGSSSPSTVSSTPSNVQQTRSVNRFRNRLGYTIKTGTTCYTNGADKQCSPPATLMNLTLYKNSTLAQNVSEMRTVGSIPHGTKVKIVQIEELNGKATAQIKWKKKFGWMSINLLSTRYQKPVGDRF